ncbi:hypothetical protein BGX27_007281, partial [Mortierella sp. AM989]
MCAEEELPANVTQDTTTMPQDAFNESVLSEDSIAHIQHQASVSKFMDSLPIICLYIDYSRDDAEFITYFEPEESFTSLSYSTFSSGDYEDESDGSYSEYNPRSQARNEIGSPMEPQQIEKLLKMAGAISVKLTHCLPWTPHRPAACNRRGMANAAQMTVISIIPRAR